MSLEMEQPQSVSSDSSDTPLSDLLGLNAGSTEPAPQQVQSEPEAPEAKPQAEAQPEAPSETPEQVLNRLMLSDPAIRQQLLQPQLQPMQPPQLQQPQPQQKAPELAPWTAEGLDFDPNDPAHLQYAVQEVVTKAIGPKIDQALQYIAQVQQQEAQLQQSRQLEQASQLFFQKAQEYVPGFEKLAESNALEDQVLYQTAQEQVTLYVQSSYPQHLWMHPEVLANAAAKVMPSIKRLYTRLKGSAPQGAGLRVEGSSTAQPGNTSGSAQVSKLLEAGKADEAFRIIAGI